MAVISNATSIIDNGAITAPKGTLNLIATLTANNSSTLAFVNGSGGVDLTAYDEFVFKFLSIHPVNDNTSFGMDIDTGANGSYDASKHTTFERTYKEANGSGKGFEPTVGFDLTNSLNRQVVYNYGANEDLDTFGGEMHIFNPSSTTYAKNFYSLCTGTDSQNGGANGGYNHTHYMSGYANTTTAISAIRFYFSSGNIQTGLIKLYGLGGS